MLKFFRRIRRKLLREGNLKNYLFYAIGEIVLVVIGILIALQINTWNNERVSDRQIKLLLQDMKEDLRRDTSYFNEVIEFVKGQMDYKKRMLSLPNFENVATDSLFVLIASRNIDHKINSNTFDKIKNLGITLNSKNKDLSEAINSYYTSASTILKDFIEWDLESAVIERNYWFFTQEEFELALNQFYIEGSSIQMLQDSLVNRQNLIKLISNPKGRNLLKMDFVTKKALFEQLLNIKAEASGLILKIEDEITGG